MRCETYASRSKSAGSGRKAGSAEVETLCAPSASLSLPLLDNIESMSIEASETLSFHFASYLKEIGYNQFTIEDAVQAWFIDQTKGIEYFDLSIRVGNDLDRMAYGEIIYEDADEAACDSFLFALSINSVKTLDMTHLSPLEQSQLTRILLEHSDVMTPVSCYELLENCSEYYPDSIEAADYEGFFPEWVSDILDEKRERFMGIEGRQQRLPLETEEPKCPFDEKLVGELKESIIALREAENFQWVVESLGHQIEFEFPLALNLFPQPYPFAYDITIRAMHSREHACHESGLWLSDIAYAVSSETPSGLQELKLYLNYCRAFEALMRSLDIKPQQVVENGRSTFY